jgi:hypothetical protein
MARLLVSSLDVIGDVAGGLVAEDDDCTLNARVQSCFS